MNKFKLLPAIVSAAIVFCPGLSASAESSRSLPDCPDFSQIKKEEFDRSAFDEAAEELKKIAADPDSGSDQRVNELTEVLLNEYSHL
ncbi:MAG: hypothetical protein ACI4JB_09475, partial [Porcipelethomonas sp.]